MELGAVDMEENLLVYMVNGRLHSKSLRPCIGFSMDKAVPAGYAVQNSVTSWPDNRLVVCCPQARYTYR